MDGRRDDDLTANDTCARYFWYLTDSARVACDGIDTRPKLLINPKAVPIYIVMGVAWVRLGGEPIPLHGYVAIIGGVFFSLLVGAGLMALVFYSDSHGYNENANRFDKE